MEHYRLGPSGKTVIAAGYFCGKCGQPSGMYGHNGRCTKDDKLVLELSELNKMHTRVLAVQTLSFFDEAIEELKRKCEIARVCEDKCDYPSLCGVNGCMLGKV